MLPTVTIIAVVLFLSIIISLVFYRAKIRELKTELVLNKEFISKHLLVVSFPSCCYIFPFVPGTKKEKVFWCEEGKSPEIIDCAVAQEKMTGIHQAHLEELEALGM